MSRKAFLIVILSLVMSICAVMPALAAERFNLSVNGETAGTIEIYGENGITMMPVDAFVRIAGADLNWDSDTGFSINENGKTLSLTVGQKEGFWDGKSVTLPVAPVSAGEGVYVPLRFVAETFGYEVTWDAQQRRILLDREETRDGLTPLDVVIKSSAATQDINTYSLDGKINMVMAIEAGGTDAAAAPVHMDMDFKGQIQSEPLEAYMRQVITAAEGAGIPETVVENYMTAEKMYIKIPEQGWIVQDMPFDPEFWQQQQDIQSNPIQAAKQMKEIGMFLSFGNDVKVNGQDYYVVNAMLDMEKFREGLPKMMQQLVQGTSGPGAAPDPGQAQSLQQMMENMEIEYYYSALVNKETFITDVIKLDARIKMDIEVPQAGTAGEDAATGQQGPEKIKMDIKMSGEINITDPGLPFNAPDVSGAKEMTGLE